MRIPIAAWLLAGFLAGPLAAPVSAAAAQETRIVSTDSALRWINEYRHSPDPAAVPALIRGLSERGAFRDPDASGVYVGFLAGVLRSNPLEARELAFAVPPLPFEDQWLLIKAVAFSGVPGWKDILRDLAARLPQRQALIDRYVTGKLPTFTTAALERESPSTWEKAKGYLGWKKPDPPPQLTFDANPDLIDTLWGFYFAAGDSGPIIQLVALLRWSKERDSVEKLTIGSMAKYTLAANASRDPELLALLKRFRSGLTEQQGAVLKEVIEAAETVQTGRIRKEAVAAIDELRIKGPGSRRDMAWWGQVGEAGISLGCIGAAVAGQVALGVPCVVGGALSSAGLRYLSN